MLKCKHCQHDQDKVIVDYSYDRLVEINMDIEECEGLEEGEVDYKAKQTRSTEDLGHKPTEVRYFCGYCWAEVELPEAMMNAINDEAY